MSDAPAASSHSRRRSLTGRSLIVGVGTPHHPPQTAHDSRSASPILLPPAAGQERVDSAGTAAAAMTARLHAQPFLGLPVKPASRRGSLTAPLGATNSSPNLSPSPAPATSATTAAAAPSTGPAASSPFLATPLRSVQREPRTTPAATSELPFSPAVLRRTNKDGVLASPPPAASAPNAAVPFSPALLKKVERTPAPATVPAPAVPAILTSPLRPVQPNASKPQYAAGASIPLPFKPDDLLQDATEREHAPPLPVDEHIVAAPEATSFEPVAKEGKAERYFHARRLSAMEAKKAAAEAETKRKRERVAASAEMVSPTVANGESNGNWPSTSSGDTDSAARWAREEAQREADRAAQEAGENAAIEALRIEAAVAELEERRLQAAAMDETGGDMDMLGDDMVAINVGAGSEHALSGGVVRSMDESKGYGQEGDLASERTGLLAPEYGDAAAGQTVAAGTIGTAGNGSGDNNGASSHGTIRAVPPLHQGYQSSSNATTARTGDNNNAGGSHSSSSHDASQGHGEDEGPAYWSYPASWAAEQLSSDVVFGLSEGEAARRLAQHGPNKLQLHRVSRWHLLWKELQQPMILLLLVVAFLYALWGEVAEAVTACAIVLITLAVELFTEMRARRALTKLSQASFLPPITVWRADVGAVRINSDELVPGDIIDVQAGERVRADGRILSPPAAAALATAGTSAGAGSTWLVLDESALTGESRAVNKDPSALLPVSAPLSARKNMLWSGTLVLQGSARMMVTATGSATRVGRTATLAQAARYSHMAHQARSPLQVRMQAWSRRLTVVAALVCMLVMSLGYCRGMNYRTVLLTGLALAFATIPEELPLLVASVLARSSLGLVQRGVLIKSLRTAEALGEVDLLLTDKTGTLTRNRLSVLRLAMPGKLLRVPRGGSGSPSETGLGGVGGDPSTVPRPFTASTEDMLAFEPLLEQGWLLSSPSLVAQLLANAGKHAPRCEPGTSPLPPETPQTAANTANDILSHAFPSVSSASAPAPGGALILDPFDAALLRFFAATRSHPRDLNSVFLRKLFADSFRVAQQSLLLHVLPYDPVRRRSSCIRRLHVSSVDVGPLRLCCRGGADSVLDVCVFALHSSGRIISLDATARAELRRTLRTLSEQGLRVMGFAVRSLLQDDLEAVEQRAAAAAQSQRASSNTTSPPLRSPSPRIDEAVEVHQPMPTAHASATSALRSTTSPRSASGAPFGFDGHPQRSPSRSATPTVSYTPLERKMTFLGFVGYGDEIRVGVADSVRKLRDMGIQVKMVTGDMPRAGAAVARAVGVLRDEDYPQPSSEEKRIRKRSRDRRSEFASGSNIDVAAVLAAGQEAPIPGVCVGRTATATPQMGHHHNRHSSVAIPYTGVMPSTLSRNPSSVSAASLSHERNASTSSSASGSGVKSPSEVLLGVKSSVSPPSASTSPKDSAYDLSASVFCRMAPAEKLALVRLYQSAGHSVLVTADGIADVASLSLADAGLAMGSSGTDLAREYAGLVLTRDDFRGVVAAISEGRRTLANLSAAVAFYLACKVALVTLFLIPLVLGMDLPLSPLHVIILEVMVDVGASIAFTSEPAAENTKASPRRQTVNQLMRGSKYMGTILLSGLLLAVSVGSVLFLAHHAVFVEQHGSSGSSHAVFADMGGVLSSVEGWPSHSLLTPLPMLPTAASPSYLHDPSGLESAGSEAAPSSHSSSSFFPDILPRFRRDPHLALTQALVMWGWIIAACLLANFMRSQNRSIMFACCDRRSVQMVKQRRQQMREREEEEAARDRRSSSLDDDLDDDDRLSGTRTDSTGSPRSALSAAMHSQRGRGYESLSAAEAGLGAHAAFIAGSKSAAASKAGSAAAGSSGRGGGRASTSALLQDDSALSDGEDSDTSSQGSANGAAQGDLEGLHKPRARAGSVASDSEYSPVLPEASLFASVCPLLSNPRLLFWAAASVTVGVICVMLPWLRASLHLDSLGERVTLPGVLGEDSASMPAWTLALIPPLVVFVLAEIAKLAVSWRTQTVASSV